MGRKRVEGRGGREEGGGRGGDGKGEGGSGNGTLPEDTVSAHLSTQVRRDTKHLTEAGIVHQVELR